MTTPMTTAPTRGPMPGLIDVEEFFADPQFAVPSISPDGTRIAYLAPHKGRRNVWVRGIDETHDDAVPVSWLRRPRRQSRVNCEV